MWWLKMALRSSRWSFTDLCVLIKYRVQFRSKRYTNGWSKPNRAHQHFSLLPVRGSVLTYLLQAWFLSFQFQLFQPDIYLTLFLKRRSFAHFISGSFCKQFEALVKTFVIDPKAKFLPKTVHLKLNIFELSIWRIVNLVAVAMEKTT